LRFEVLPTPIFTIIFFTAPQNGRILAVAAQNDLESILRKWVYSFKHSGNSRGDHRGPEKVSPDQRSGREMGDLDHRPRLPSNFLKKRSESKLSAFVFLVGWRRLGFCRVCAAPIDSSGKGPVGIAFFALQFEPCSPSIRSADIADDAEFSTARTSRSFAGQDSWLPLQIWPFSAFLAEQQHNGSRSSMV
jgi:hypothetical protein